MTGALLLRESTSFVGKYERAQLVLEPTPDCPFEIVSFQDVRRFGTWNVVDALKDGLPRQIGPDALAPDFTADHLSSALRRKSGTVKGALLDQSTLAGLGNIYVDEVLWKCRIHPTTSCNKISSNKIKRLLVAIPKILQKSIDFNGTTIINFSPGNKTKGKFSNYLNVFGKQNQGCPNCKTSIRKIFVSQRGTHFCPKCQKC